MPNINRAGFGMIVLSTIGMMVTSANHTFREPRVMIPLVVCATLGCVLGVMGEIIMYWRVKEDVDSSR
jgi:hypothetical protein